MSPGLLSAVLGPGRRGGSASPSQTLESCSAPVPQPWSRPLALRVSPPGPVQVGVSACSSCRGLPSQAFEYIRYNKGIMGEDSYPYKGQVILHSRGFTVSARGAAQRRPPQPRGARSSPPP